MGHYDPSQPGQNSVSPITEYMTFLKEALWLIVLFFITGCTKNTDVKYKIHEKMQTHTGCFSNCSAQISALKKRCSTNDDLLYIVNFMEQNLWLAAHRFSFWYWKLEGAVKKTLCMREQKRKICMWNHWLLDTIMTYATIEMAEMAHIETRSSSIWRSVWLLRPGSVLQVFVLLWFL